MAPAAHVPVASAGTPVSTPIVNEVAPKATPSRKVFVAAECSDWLEQVGPLLCLHQ